MKRYLCGALALLALIPVAYGQGTSVTETILLKYLDAKAIPATMTTLNGIEQLTCDFAHNSVIVRGGSKAVAAFKAEVEKVDVPPTVHKMEMRLVRCHIDAKGKRTEETLLSPVIKDMDKSPASISIASGQAGYALLVTPLQDGNDTVRLVVEVRELGEQGEIILSGKNTRRVIQGETVRITGMVETMDRTLRRAVQQGKIVTDRGEYTGYYVEVKPTIFQEDTAPARAR